MYLSHTHTLTKEYSSEIYLHGKICHFLMFTAVTYNKVGFFYVYSGFWWLRGGKCLDEFVKNENL